MPRLIIDVGDGLPPVGFSLDADDLLRLAAFVCECREWKARTTTARGALQAAHELCTVALPQFNWGASVLNAEGITLLNEVPGKIYAALKGLEHPDDK